MIYIHSVLDLTKTIFGFTSSPSTMLQISMITSPRHIYILISSQSVLNEMMTVCYIIKIIFSEIGLVN